MSKQPKFNVHINMGRGRHVYVSVGNTKIGWMLNVSLLPGVTCGKVPCIHSCYAFNMMRAYPDLKHHWTANTRVALRHQDLFFAALDVLLRAPITTKEITVRNGQAYYSPVSRNPSLTWESFPPRLFRWHVSGDFPNQRYLDGVKEFARRHPTIRFLAFTKRHSWDFSNLPRNLSIVFSMWPGYYDENDHRFPKAWLYGSVKAHSYMYYRKAGARAVKHFIPGIAMDPRVPGEGKGVSCLSQMKKVASCTKCGLCWNLKNIGKDVVFALH